MSDIAALVEKAGVVRDCRRIGQAIPEVQPGRMSCAPAETLDCVRGEKGLARIAGWEGDAVRCDPPVEPQTSIRPGRQHHDRFEIAGDRQHEIAPVSELFRERLRVFLRPYDCDEDGRVQDNRRGKPLSSKRRCSMALDLSLSASVQGGRVVMKDLHSASRRAASIAPTRMSPAFRRPCSASVARAITADGASPVRRPISRTCSPAR